MLFIDIEFTLLKMFCGDSGMTLAAHDDDDDENNNGTSNSLFSLAICTCLLLEV